MANHLTCGQATNISLVYLQCLLFTIFYYCCFFSLIFPPHKCSLIGNISLVMAAKNFCCRTKFWLTGTEAKSIWYACILMIWWWWYTCILIIALHVDTIVKYEFHFEGHYKPNYFANGLNWNMNCPQKMYCTFSLLRASLSSFFLWILSFSLDWLYDLNFKKVLS